MNKAITAFAALALAVAAADGQLVMINGPAGPRAAAVGADTAGLHIPRGKQVGFTTYLNDGAGFRWDLQYHLNVGQGTNYAYGGGVYCQINNTNVTSNGMGWMNPAGDEIEIGPWNPGRGFQVYRRCKVYRDQGLARWLDIFVNTSGSAITIPVRIYTCTNSNITQTATSSGGASFTSKDWAFVTTPQHGRPSLLHIVCGPRSKLRPTVNVSGNSIYTSYSIRVPANGTAVLCYFESQGHSAEDLKKRMAKFDIRAALADLSPAVQKLIVNFPSGGGFERIELTRSGTSDTALLTNGDPIYGKITNEQFTIEAFYGTLKLPAEKILGFAIPKGRDRFVHAVLVGGQVVSGRMGDAALKLALPTGGMQEIPFAQLSQCSYRLTKAKPKDCPITDPLIMLRTGDRLAFDPADLKCEFLTRHGRVQLRGEDLLEIRLTHEEGGVHRAVFINGSRLAGMLVPERIILPTRLGPKLDISRDKILAFRFAEETREDASLAGALLSNEDELAGRLADEAYTVTTDFGTIRLKPANITAMAFDRHEPDRVVIRMWNGTVHRGRLRQKALRFAVTPGPVLDLHVGQIVRLICPEALPTDDIVKEVDKYIAMLSASSFKDREEAQAALSRMGKSIVPLLRKYADDTDPEVRQRIGAILEELGDDVTPAAPSPPGMGGPFIKRWG